MIIYYALIIPMTLMAALGSFYLKKSTSADPLISVFFNRYLYIGGILYVFGALINIYLLKFIDYSIVLPLSSFTYVLTTLMSYFLMHEGTSKRKILGLICIIAGSVGLAVSDLIVD